MPITRSLVVFFLVAMVLVAGAPLFAQRQAVVPEDVVFERDVVYGKAGEVELKLNMARPKGHDDKAKPLPVVVIIHGGGWAAGSREGHNDLTWQFAKRGYLAVTISYRFAPAFLFPAQVEDAKCAVRFLRASAKKLNIDAERIGAVGFSAGAHLSMMLATMDPADGMEGEGGHKDQASKVQAAVSFVGPTDLTVDDLPETSRNIIKNWLGGDLKAIPDVARKASPITYVNKDDSPMLLLQGTVDPLIPNTQAYRMAEAMTKAGVQGRVELVIGGGHGWGGKEMEHSAAQMFEFFDRWLKR